MRFTKRLGTGTGLVTAAAAWAAIDALAHVRADMVEPLRIAGNLAVGLAWAVSLVTVRGEGGARTAAAACGIAAGLVLGLNVVWAVDQGELRIAAAVFIGLAVLLLVLATRRFRRDAAAHVGNQ